MSYETHPTHPSNVYIQARMSDVLCCTWTWTVFDYRLSLHDTA